MQTGLTIQELGARVLANKALKRDYIVESPSLSMEIDDDGKPALIIPEIASPTRLGVLSTAHNQLGERLGIPAKYYDRMLATAPDLLAANVNRWFREQPQKRMVRSLGGDARAFLSNRYNRIENEEIVAAAIPVLREIPDVHFVSTEVTDRRMYLQAVAPRIQGQVAVGDVVQAGVIISNSEIGMGSVSVAAMLYRLRCKNGMIVGEKFRQYHIGRAVEDTSELWADDTRQADDRTVLLKVRDMVRAAVDGAKFAQRIEQAQGLTAVKVSGNPVRAVEVLAAKIGANETEQDAILRALVEGGDLSAWGLLNAVTAQAHNAEQSYDRAVEFEAAGGALLDLPKGEWSRILEAA